MSIKPFSHFPASNIESTLSQSSESARIQSELNTSIKNLSEKIKKKLNTDIEFGNFFYGMHNKIANFFHKGRAVSLKNIQENLKGGENSYNILNELTKEEKKGLSWSVKHDYKKILKLQKSLLEKLSALVSPEEIVEQHQEEQLPVQMESKLSNEKFKELWKQVNLGGKNNGQGSFGMVYSVRDEDSGKEYVIKVPNLFSSIRQHKSDPKIFASLKTVIAPEIQEEKKSNIALHKGMESLNDSQKFYEQAKGFITVFYGMFEVDELPVLVYEKAEGKEFKALLQDEENAIHPCTEDNVSERCAVLVQMGCGIQISHDSGVVNRDIKPENLMVHVSNDSEHKGNKFIQTKLIDQGLAYDLKNPNKNDGTAIDKGTEMFLAPEMLDEENGVKKNGISPAADVYAYGISIVQALTSNEFWNEQVDGDFSKNGIVEKRQAGTLFNNLSKPKFLIEQMGAKKIPKFYTDEQCDFLQGLLRDCLNPDPAERPSAAQVAELLQLFSSSLKGNGGNGEIMPYSDAKKITEKDRPKAIPIAIRDMIFNENEEISKQGLNALDSLVKADPSYINTPSYGLIKIKEGEESYKSWRNNYPEAAQNLKDWTYRKGDKATGDQNIPITQSAYDVIHYK